MPRGDAAAGKEKSDSQRCIECHGADAQRNVQTEGSAGTIAKLAGQAPEYMVKQIRDFRSGERKHDFMAIMARSIDDEDAADIAAYFGAQPVMQGDGAGGSAAARELYLRGDPARRIAACIECHGEGGKGKAIGGVKSPVIGGQALRYLEKQLLEWRSGERRNSPDGAMNRVTQSLTEREIEALASYLAGL